MKAFSPCRVILVLIGFSLAPLHAQTIWNNGGDGYYWATAANWSAGEPVSSSNVQIGAVPSLYEGQIDVNTGGATTIASLTFNSSMSGSASLVPNGTETLQINGAITNNSSYNQSLSLGVTAGANAAYAGGSGLTFNQLTVGTDDITTSGNILVNDLVLTINSASSFGQFGGFTGTGTTPKINVIGTYTGTAGNSFQLITGSFSGATLGTLPTLTAGLSWNTSLFAADGTISVVPEPSPVDLLFLGLALMAFAKLVLKPRAWRLGDARS